MTVLRLGRNALKLVELVQFRHGLNNIVFVILTPFALISSGGSAGTFPDRFGHSQR